MILLQYLEIDAAGGREAEQAFVLHEGATVKLKLWDGRELVFDRDELLDAVEPVAAERNAA